LAAATSTENDLPGFSASSLAGSNELSALFQTLLLGRLQKDQRTVLKKYVARRQIKNKYSTAPAIIER
jgi:hypothetical protein